MLPNWYTQYKNLIDLSIKNYLESYFEKNTSLSLKVFPEVIFYSSDSGKRIRAILALEFYQVFSEKTIKEIKEDDDIIKFCIVLELLHAYSLVHDDLPAMDNDDYRRGKLTTWKKFGEANAILAGDLLNSLAFEIISEIKNKEIGFILLKLFGNAVGINGMIGGQILDLYYENNIDELDLEKLKEVHDKKTGALIEISIIGGILLSNKDMTLEKYRDFGKKIGLAFQIKDDLLDNEGNLEETGKSVGGENKGFVYFLGLEETHKYLDVLIIDCKDIISELKSEKLDFLIDYIGNRKN